MGNLYLVIDSRASLSLRAARNSAPSNSVISQASHDPFSSFGNILSCKIATDGFGQSKGYGLVQFDNEESAQRKGNCTNKTKFNNIFVKNLTESTTDEDLKKIFGEYGTITSAVVMRDGDGKSKCFGFVNFENADDAAKTVDALNGDREWYVGKAQIISGREKEL
ncbi:hypothetical protein WN944_024127 [Citrus x changshan-huyou]|uniref:RRM domain-containing protein n=1 Tax=Citrus x changshan-huyou TaxID=2935761 RepID=A0AAP0LTM2_9ROSI